MDSTIRAFCKQQREWLEAELQSKDQDDAFAAAAAATATATATSSRSNVLTGLQVEEMTVGLYGRTVVTLQKAAAATATATATGTSCEGASSGKSLLLLPAHRFTTGDEVEIRTKTSTPKQNQAGVVSQVTETSISVALFGNNKNKNSNNQQQGDDENDILSQEAGGALLMLVPSRSVEVHKKYMAALSDLEKLGTQHPVAGKVVRAMFEAPNLSQKTNTNPNRRPFVPFNDRLDASQLEAIQFCLNSNDFDGNSSDDRPVCCIHGPPGTGKTTTLVELIRQAVHVHGKKVLVAAPSNVAVDNILSRLVAAEQKQNTSHNYNNKIDKKRNNNDKKQVKRIRAVRLGHPARLQPEILPYSLEALVASSDGTEIVDQVRNELASFLKVLANPKSRGNDKRIAYREMKTLRQELRQREEKVVRELLQSAQVVFATCVGAANSILNKNLSHHPDEPFAFDLCVIDEAAQALEAACWIPVLRGKRLILAGDHKQLPPTIQSNIHSVNKGLANTMFERVMQLYGDDHDHHDMTNNVVVAGRVSRMLQVQYRMHRNISDWASQALYGGKLQTHDTVAGRTLEQLVDDTGRTKDKYDNGEFEPMLLVDTAGCAMHEGVNAAGSRFNEMEAQIVGQHVRRLIEYGVSPEQIAVITPYNGQVELLRSILLSDFPRLEIRSVDGFQGGEREAVVLSLVRSSSRGGTDGIGFLRDDRRLNVAVTRAKRHVCVICDSETVSQSSFVKNLLDWMEQHGETRSALEFFEGGKGLVNNNNPQMQSDLVAAKQELARIMLENEPSKVPAKQQQQQQTDQKNQSSKREPPEKDYSYLLQGVQQFVQNAKPGDELVLDTELSSGDRRAVHEEAEKLGIEHKSEGVNGVDRRLVLRIPKEEKSADGTIATDDHGAPDAAIVALAPDTDIFPTPTGQTFAALETEESSGSEADTKEEDSATLVPMNSMLGDLARERLERQRQRTTQKAALPQQNMANNKSANKKKSKKLGGKPKPATEMDAGEDDMDDMAFLDAQIEKVQTSHGRKVDAKGTYRTIVNGILLSKPETNAEKKKDSSASAALHAKLKNAQDGRKAQKKKK